MKVTIEDTEAMAKIGAGVMGAPRKREALAAAIDNVKSDCENYVPYKTGQLWGSTNTSRAENGIISWDTSYAAIVYHMPTYANWTRNIHSRACPQWVEVVANSGGRERWQKIIQAVLNG